MAITRKGRKTLYLTPENGAVYFKVKQPGSPDCHYILSAANIGEIYK
jgi:hypothetical protein